MIFTYIINSALPIMLIAFIIAGLARRINVFDAFLKGAMKGIISLYRVAPSILALVFAVKLLRGSGLTDMVADFLEPVTSVIKIPSEIMPLALLRPISGSGSTALLADIFETSGPDSVVGLMASVLCCSSETTFYTIAVYYGACGIKKTRHTVIAAVCADIASVIFSVLFVNILF